MKYVTLMICCVLVLGSCGRADRVASKDQRGLMSFVKKAVSRDAPAPVGGGLCGDPMLVGENAGAVPGRISGCGIEDAVRVRQVGDITLSQPALMNCTTARALRTWVEDGAVPAVGREGGGIASLRVAAHYACRTRNHQAGARISEHGKGNAIDISGITLKNGRTITLLDGWNARGDRRILRDMHEAACGPFGTVLGPESDRFHKDHFHFDTASYRSGPYCR